MGHSIPFHYYFACVIFSIFFEKKFLFSIFFQKKKKSLSLESCSVSHRTTVESIALAHASLEMSVFLDGPFTVNTPNTTVTDDEILSTYVYNTCQVEGSVVTPTQDTYQFKTSKKVPKTGMLLVGWGGNNGSTVRCRGLQ
jgi:hypothetical protein